MKSRPRKSLTSVGAWILALIGLVGLTSAEVPRAWAGKEVGNGGGAWVCGNLNGSLRHVQLVDLFEARVEFGLTLVSPGNDSYKELVMGARARLGQANPALLGEFDRNLQLVMNSLELIGNEATLEQVDDLFSRIRPAANTCPGGRITFEQVANFTHYRTTLVSAKILNAMDPLNKAALFVHEAIYSMLRTMAGDLNSVRTRRWVGLLFSTQPPVLFKAEFQIQKTTQSGSSHFQ